jgi:ribosome-interacting GTPase 1
MARTQKNKATANHLGILKAKLAKLKAEILAPRGTVEHIHIHGILHL